MRRRCARRRGVHGRLRKRRGVRMGVVSGRRGGGAPRASARGGGVAGRRLVARAPPLVSRSCLVRHELVSTESEQRLPRIMSDVCCTSGAGSASSHESSGIPPFERTCWPSSTPASPNAPSTWSARAVSASSRSSCELGRVWGRYGRVWRGTTSRGCAHAARREVGEGARPHLVRRAKERDELGNGGLVGDATIQDARVR